MQFWGKIQVLQRWAIRRFSQPSLVPGIQAMQQQSKGTKPSNAFLKSEGVNFLSPGSIKVCIEELWEEVLTPPCVPERGWEGCSLLEEGRRFLSGEEGRLRVRRGLFRSLLHETCEAACLSRVVIVDELAAISGQSEANSGQASLTCKLFRALSMRLTRSPATKPSVLWARLLRWEHVCTYMYVHTKIQWTFHEKWEHFSI